MNRHWKGVLAIILFAVFGFAIAIAVHHPMWGFLAVIVALVVGYVMAIDWMRPQRPPNADRGNRDSVAETHSH